MDGASAGAVNFFTIWGMGMTSVDITEILDALIQFTGYDWDLYVRDNELEVICEKQIIYKGSYQYVEDKLLNLAGIMMDIYRESLNV